MTNEVDFLPCQQKMIRRAGCGDSLHYLGALGFWMRTRNGLVQRCCKALQFTVGSQFDTIF